MNEPAKTEPEAVPLPPVTPIGSWIVGGFLLFASLAMWGLVAIIFQVRN